MPDSIKSSPLRVVLTAAKPSSNGDFPGNAVTCISLVGPSTAPVTMVLKTTVDFDELLTARISTGGYYVPSANYARIELSAPGLKDDETVTIDLHVGFGQVRSDALRVAGNLIVEPAPGAVFDVSIVDRDNTNELPVRNFRTTRTRNELEKVENGFNVPALFSFTSPTNTDLFEVQSGIDIGAGFFIRWNANPVQPDALMRITRLGMYFDYDTEAVPDTVGALISNVPTASVWHIKRDDGGVIEFADFSNRGTNNMGILSSGTGFAPRNESLYALHPEIQVYLDDVPQVNPDANKIYLRGAGGYWGSGTGIPLPAQATHTNRYIANARVEVYQQGTNSNDGSSQTQIFGYFADLQDTPLYLKPGEAVGFGHMGNSFRLLSPNVMLRYRLACEVRGLVTNNGNVAL